MIASETLCLDRLFEYLFEMEIFLMEHKILYTYNIYVSGNDFYRVEITTYDN